MNNGNAGFFRLTSASGAGRVSLWHGPGRDGGQFQRPPAAKFAVPTAEGIRVDVPAGASLGPITVTAPEGTFTTAQSFTVE